MFPLTFVVQLLDGGSLLLDVPGAGWFTSGSFFRSRTLKFGLVQSNTSTQAARGQLAVCWGELGGENHVTVRVDGADLSEAAGLDGQAVG